MTGYGRKEVRAGGSLFIIEVRSVNNRYLDVQVKMPRALSVLESRVRKGVQDRFSRGRFDLFITRNGGEEKTERLILDEERAEQYLGLLRELRDRFGLPGEIDLRLIAAAPDIITIAETREEPEALWQALSEGLSQALDELDRMRADEGAALARDIAGRLESIEGTLRTVRSRAPRTIEGARKRIAEAVSRLAGEQADPARLAQEIAFLAERTDVSEELTRMDSHVRQFRAMLDGAKGGATGRKLDFLLQEMVREMNTVASKALDAEISLAVVNVKAELEKIREQVQNIE